jgi:hypothetical protein
MPYRIALSATQALSPQDQMTLSAEFDAVRAELDDMRAKYAALVALLAAATALGAGYNTGTTLAAPRLSAV